MSVESDIKTSIESRENDFDDTPAGQYKYWSTEFQAADKEHGKFYKRGRKVVDKYLNNTRGKSADGLPDDTSSLKLNFFHSTVNVVKDMMFGKLPEVTFKRSDDDPDDDVARVAGMILERMLNNDIGTPKDDFSDALKDALLDRLLPGLGLARVRYDYESETVALDEEVDEEGNVIEEAYEYEDLLDECAPIEYVNWNDFKWSPCQRWAELRWMAFCTYPTRDDLVKKFGKKVGKKIPLNAGAKDKNGDTDIDNSGLPDAMKRAALWEIWDKETRKVYWYVEGYGKIIEEQDDPLELTGFFPVPRPLAANITTSEYLPLADYTYAQDLYNEIDDIETRLSILTDAVRATGAYNSAFPELQNILNDTGEAGLVGVDGWDAFAERGGLKGAIDWVPIETIAKTITELTARRNDLISLLFQITGIADIMRGAKQAAGAVTATERALEARFASVKVQALQDEFARFATDLIRMRAEIVSKHFEPQTIIEQSNIMFTADAQYAQQAIQLIKDREALVYRIEVKPESVAMVDYAQLKTERTEYITALATFMQSAAPLIEQDPGAAPPLLALLKWGMAGFKGSQDVEGILDQAINQINKKLSNPQAQQAQKSDAQIKAEMEAQKQQYEAQKQKRDHMMRYVEMQHERQMKGMEADSAIQQIILNAQKDLEVELAQADLNIQERTHETDEKIRELREQARLQPKKQASNE